MGAREKGDTEETGCREGLAREAGGEGMVVKRDKYQGGNVRVERGPAYDH